MIDNERIEARKRRRRRRRRVLVGFELILILLLIGAVLYGLLVVYPAWTDGRLDLALPPFLRERVRTEGAAQEPEPTRLPVVTPTPLPTATPTTTPTATPTPEPTPALPPELEQIALPSYENHDPSEWNLILVNGDHLIPEDYSFELAYIDENEEYAVDVRILEPLRAMLQDCTAAGYTPEVCSAFRTSDTQSYLFVESEEENSEEETPAVAAPGTSEHELGLAVDIYSSENIDLDETQENTETQQWLMEHCWEYGFILRYPRHKSEITGIIYEPWHYRYVGRDAAKDIAESGLCLEEYLENMSRVREAKASL